MNLNLPTVGPQSLAQRYENYGKPAGRGAKIIKHEWQAYLSTTSGLSLPFTLVYTVAAFELTGRRRPARCTSYRYMVGIKTNFG